MGYSKWSSEDYSVKTRSYVGKSRSEIFKSNTANRQFSAKEIVLRESCDSEQNPQSNALIFALDVTGSMGFIAEAIARKGLGKLVEGILERRPVADPHIMMMAIGDVFHDRHPLQATQFEPDIKISDQLEELYLEGGGGGNGFESYDLAWLFAALKTKIDCWDKRQTKGYLFTVGDEEPPETANIDTLRREGINLEANITADQALQMAQERYNVFHIIVEEGNHCRYRGGTVCSKWSELLGKRAILLDNHNNLPEVVISTIMVNEGTDPNEVVDTWNSDSIKKSVKRALFGMM